MITCKICNTDINDISFSKHLSEHIKSQDLDNKESYVRKYFSCSNLNANENSDDFEINKISFREQTYTIANGAIDRITCKRTICKNAHNLASSLYKRHQISFDVYVESYYEPLNKKPSHLCVLCNIENIKTNIKADVMNETFVYEHNNTCQTESCKKSFFNKIWPNKEYTSNSWSKIGANIEYISLTSGRDIEDVKQSKAHGHGSNPNLDSNNLDSCIDHFGTKDGINRYIDKIMRRMSARKKSLTDQSNIIKVKTELLKLRYETDHVKCIRYVDLGNPSESMCYDISLFHKKSKTIIDLLKIGESASDDEYQIRLKRFMKLGYNYIIASDSATIENINRITVYLK